MPGMACRVGREGRDADHLAGELGAAVERLGGEQRKRHDVRVEAGRGQHARENERGEVVGLVVRGDHAYRRNRLVRRLPGFPGGFFSIFDVIDDAACGVEEEAHVRLVERAGVAVLLGEPERGNHDLAVKREQPFFVGVGFGEVLGVFLVHGDEALVEARLGREHRLDAEQHVEDINSRAPGSRTR